jgi:hypothetical protein
MMKEMHIPCLLLSTCKSRFLKGVKGASLDCTMFLARI